MTVTKKVVIPAASVGTTGKVYRFTGTTSDYMPKKPEPLTGKNARTSNDYTNFNEWRKDSLKIKPTSVEPIKLKIIDIGKGKPRKVSLE